MTIVSGGFKGVIELVDNGGDVETKSYDLTSADAAAAATDIAAIATALLGVSDMVLRKRYFYELFVNDAFAYPASGVEKQNKALIALSIVDQPTKTATVTIPAPKPAIFVGSSGPQAEIVDGADAAVIAYVALFENGGKATVSDGETAEGFIEGHRIHRASSHG